MKVFYNLLTWYRNDGSLDYKQIERLRVGHIPREANSTRRLTNSRLSYEEHVDLLGQFHVWSGVVLHYALYLTTES